jgi:hypothetical protein
MTTDFGSWAQACVDYSAALLCDGLPRALEPRVDGAAATRTERHVSFEHPQRGRFSVWLYVVPPEHAYATGARAPKHGAGIMDGSRQIVPQAAVRQWFTSGNPFRWQKLDGGLELCVLVESIRSKDEPDAVASRFAPRVTDGLRQAGFF